MKHKPHTHYSCYYNLLKPQEPDKNYLLFPFIVICVGIAYQMLGIQSQAGFQFCFCIERMYIVRLDGEKSIFAISV